MVLLRSFYSRRLENRKEGLRKRKKIKEDQTILLLLQLSEFVELNKASEKFKVKNYDNTISAVNSLNLYVITIAIPVSTLLFFLSLYNLYASLTLIVVIAIFIRVYILTQIEIAFIELIIALLVYLLIVWLLGAFLNAFVEDYRLFIINESNRLSIRQLLFYLYFLLAFPVTHIIYRARIYNAEANS